MKIFISIVKCFLFVLMFLLLTIPVNAQFLNPYFNEYASTGNCSQYTGNCPTHWTTVATSQYYGMSVILHGGVDNSNAAFMFKNAWMSQEVYLNYNMNISLWARSPGGSQTIEIYVDSVLLDSFSTTAIGGFHAVDTSSLSGFKTIKFNTPLTTGYTYVDNILLSDPAPSYIAWTTYPPDSWAVGNYSTLIISVPDTAVFDFYYKIPEGEYVLTPIQKSFFGRYWNIEEGCFYQDYLKTCYHAAYGNYSAKIIGNIAASEENRYVPYFNPEIDIPDVIVIPIPDVYVDPPQWNVTLPPKYENVTWLNDYTVFWDGVGNSINYTMYATVGLLLIPVEMLNSSVSTIHTYAVSASGMVSGFEHCAIIVKVGWDVIPPEMQSLFIGAACLGLVIFLYHRRT